MNSQNKTEISSEEMVIQDVNSEYLGIPRYLLMENAGKQIAQYCESLLKNKKATIAVFCGTGGNGGDGFVAARHLHDSYTVEVFIVGSNANIKSKSALKNFKALNKLKTIKLIELTDSKEISDLELERYDLLIDGLLGTGLVSTTIKEPQKSVIEAINSKKTTTALVVSIDIPSGLKKDGSVASVYIEPTHTVALHQAKLGTYSFGKKVTVVPIGIPKESNDFTGPGLFTLYPKRSKTSHKGQNGKILIVGGSSTYHGSMVLAGKAAFSLNIDLVFMITSKKITSALRTSDYRFIIKSYQEDFLTPQVVDNLVKPMIAEVDSILVGPGLGSAPETILAVKNIFKLIPNDKTLILDADALKACQGELLPMDTIVTPHAGEFTILTGKKLDQKADITERVVEITEGIKKYTDTLTWVVKGPVDVIKQGSKQLLNYTGTPSMTTGGTGDILAGLVTAMRSQVKNSFYASAMATFLIGKAGEFADQKNFTLQELLDNIPVVLKEIKNFIDEKENLLLKK